MNKKALLIYLCKYLPFVFGIGLLSFGGINLISVLLIVIGSYIIIKNLFDYRKVKKNYDDIWEYSGKCHSDYNKERVSGCTKKYVKNRMLVRKRVK